MTANPAMNLDPRESPHPDPETARSTTRQRQKRPSCPGCGRTFIKGRSHCPECHADYSPKGGGHCRGGAYGGCCRTFTSDSSAGKHRVGPHEPRDARRCLTETELIEAGWRLTDRGWTNEPPMPEGAHR